MPAEGESVVMHATLIKSQTTASKRGPKYQLGFEVPQAFGQLLADMHGAPIEVYWNEQQISATASIKGLRCKYDKDSGINSWVFGLDIDFEDLGKNAIQSETQTVGDLRLHVRQQALFSAS